MEAIARKRAIVARYNGSEIKLAPHLMFERRGDLFVSALNMSKDWRTDDERKLGQFKLAGLGGTALLDERFEPLPSFDAATPRSDDTLILAI
ncbi:WYL domain-containing protein [Novosphingobium lentum]|uniref:WYL domain-containing protein n=1 Tax=Novosphingobium lentum TaxID=145287 RepID=UPI001FE09263|nr:WYL domain-containing protein [Novosphingobium lentum]